MKSLALCAVLFCGLLATAATLTGPQTQILDEKAIDRGQNPCENFYQYACGGWIQSVTLPSDKNSIYRQGAELEVFTDQLLNQILKDFADGKTSTAEEQKLGQYYGSCMNPDTSSSLSSLQKQIENIKKQKGSEAFADLMGLLHLQGHDALFNYSVYPDINDSRRSIGYLGEGGLGLGGREAYFGDPANPQDVKWKETLKEYEAHISRTLQIVGFSVKASQTAAHQILDLETKLASKALSREELRDPDATNHPMKISELVQLAPDFDWAHYFAALGDSKLSELNVTEPAFISNLNLLLKTDAKVLKPYLIWKLVHGSSVQIGGKLGEEYFKFFGQYLRGKKTMEERWKTCTHLVGDGMGDALGKAYVAHTNGAQARDATSSMIGELKETFQEELKNLSWLDESTRQAAVLKLQKLQEKVGYPDRWKNYDSLILSADSFLADDFSATIYKNMEAFARAGQPVDKYLWDMPPWEINAYYDPSQNEFVFPLAQLLPPSLDLTASDGANWGALGATLGHEMSHGYDDEGHQYDADGNLKDWWTASVSKEFEAKAQCYVDQANQYEALPGLFVNGRATLGENLADQGGTKFAYLSYKKAQALRGTPAPDFAGFNEEQQFFLAYAQSWCSKTTDASLRLQVQTDPHPPSEFRVNMVLKNLKTFRQAFQCAEGTKMAPAKTCELW